MEKRIQNLEERLRRANAREIELEAKITALTTENFSLKDRSLTGSKLEIAVQQHAEIERLTKEISTIKLNFASAASVWENQLKEMRGKYPGDRFNLNHEISGILQRSGVSVYNINGVETIEVKSEKTIEVPVQDTRTKQLIHLLAVNLRNLSSKYPKLLTELDQRLVEYFQQELIDVIEVDELDRVVEIIKYVPQAVRVENTFSYGCTKNRKV